MNTQGLRKTHPMVLTAAAAVTVFSVLGSAAVTGLIPSAHSERMEPTPVATTDSAPLPEQSRQADTFRSAVSGKGEGKAVSASRADAGQAPAKPKSSLARTEAGKSAVCRTCGVIESIRTVETEGDGSGLGAVAGGVVGGVAGNQIGKGKGNTLMTLIGIGGGAYAGHTIEKKMKSATAYVVKVRMEDGTYRTVTQQSQPDLAVGDHVKVASGQLTAA